MTNNTIYKYYVFIFILFLWAGCDQESSEPYRIVKTATSPSAMVVTAHPLATEIGVQVLKDGGNAIDAAIAVQFALGVVYPNAGNIGGGGFMLIRQPDGKAYALDFREKASLAATRNMYLDSTGNVIPDRSILGHRSVGVPGSVDGMCSAHDRFGSLSLKRLIAPAIKLARDGIRLTSREAHELNLARAEFLSVNQSARPFVQSSEWKMGEAFIQKDLSETLERIASKGRAGFYAGPTARMIIEDQKRGNGLITQIDLDKYQSVWREPLRGWYKDFEILSMPPPSSGGVALLQLLEGMEDRPFQPADLLSVSTIHDMAEVMRRVFADRAVHLGDPDWVDVPVEQLLDTLYIRKRMADIQNQATSSDSIAAGVFPLYESEQTTHFSIVDPAGMAVAVTTTLNLEFGSKVIVQGGGFLLNNEMDDFSAKPGVPNAFGLLGSTANEIAPEKRMLSSMTPAIVSRDGQVRLVVGTPGGSKIITTVFQIMMDALTFDLDLQTAVALPRFHHQWRPDTLFVEEGRFDPDTLKALRLRGHRVIERSSIGRVDAIWVAPDGMLTGAADPRGDDHAAGF